MIPTLKWSPSPKWSPNRPRNDPQWILGMEWYSVTELLQVCWSVYVLESHLTFYYSLCDLLALLSFVSWFCLLCSSPSRSTCYILIFVHPFVRHRSLFLLPPHPLLHPKKLLVCQVNILLWTPSRISFVPFLLVSQGLPIFFWHGLFWSLGSCFSVLVWVLVLECGRFGFNYGVLCIGYGYLGSLLHCLALLLPVSRAFHWCHKPTKDARAPILIIEVKVRPVKIVHNCIRSKICELVSGKLSKCLYIHSYTYLRTSSALIECLVVHNFQNGCSTECHDW